MTADLLPLRLLFLTLAGWVNRHQQHGIDYLVEENRVPKTVGLLLHRTRTNLARGRAVLVSLRRYAAAMEYRARQRMPERRSGRGSGEGRASSLFT